jgi:signal transduction histidine kinase
MSELSWLLRAARRHPLVVDALFQALLIMVTATWIWPAQRDAALALLLTIGMCVPLVWRRRHPLAVFLGVAAVAFAQWRVHIQLAADLALLVAFYTVAAYRSTRETLLAAGVLELGVVLASVHWSPRWFDSFIFLSALVVVAGVLGVNTRIRRAYLASLEERAVRLEAERDQQAQLAAAAERARISREMHDVVAHSLTVMVALADGAAFHTRPDPDRAVDAVAKLSATGRTALAEMRRLLGILCTADDPRLRPQPGIGQLDELVGQVRAAGLPVTLVLEGDPSTVPSGAQLAVYRLVQEALTNTLKHAGRAASARVRLRFAAGTVDVDVSDTGTGTGNGASRDGHGIAGMRERAAIYGGEVSAGPDPDGGWRVRTLLHLDAVR